MLFLRYCNSELILPFNLVIYLFGVLRRFQHCTGHITMGSWKGRGNQYIQFIRVLYCFIYLFIWGFTSLSTLYRSYHDG